MNGSAEIHEVRLVGRGGQGVVTAGDLLGSAAVHEGRWAQSIPTFGPERRGALCMSTLRIGAEELLLPNLLAAIGFCASTSEARRLIQGGGVKVDGGVAADPKSGLGPGTYHVQAGKRKHARVTVS